jgi:PilZ domain
VKTISKHLTADRDYNNMEKRKFTRFRVQDDAFAAIRGNFTKVGKIDNISLNGMAFRYLAEKIAKEISSHSQVDIFLTNNSFNLIGVPCNIIYDVNESTYFKNDEIISRRCGIKFGSLKEEDKENLEFFINNHTTGVLNS